MIYKINTTNTSLILITETSKSKYLMTAQFLKKLESHDSFRHSSQYCKYIIRSVSHVQCCSNKVSGADVKHRALCVGRKQLLRIDQGQSTLLYCANDTALLIAVTLTCLRAEINWKNMSSTLQIPQLQLKQMDP